MQKEHCMLRLFYCVILTFAIFSGSSCSSEPLEETALVAAINRPEVEQEMLDLVNTHRVALGYNPLQYSTVAYTYASSHNDYMIARGSLSHDNFSARASGIAEEVDAAFVAENIARDYATAQAAFSSWLASSSHQKTIEGDFTHTAVSVKADAAGDLYYTQLFFR